MTRELARFAPARGKLAVMTAGLGVFTGVAAWMLWVTPAGNWGSEGAGLARAVLWAAVLICPVCAVDLGARLVRRTPTLVATKEGLLFRSALGAGGAVRWEEVTMIAPVEMGRKLWLAIYLREPVATLGQFGLLARLMLAKSHAEGVPNIAFRSIQLGVPPERAAETLERIRKDRA